MPVKSIIYILILSFRLALIAQDSSDYVSPTSGNLLDDYINDLGEMGQTLSGWKGDSETLGSWFFGSYAMLLLQNNGHNADLPFPGLEATVPALWSDFKYITPRYLVELAGGALSNGHLMAITEEQPFSSRRTEEKFILNVAGFSYLRMLQSTIGDSLYSQIIRETILRSPTPTQITNELINTIGSTCGTEMGEQFGLALSSSNWTDVELSHVKTRSSGLEITIKHKGVWHFPVEVMAISATGDTSLFVYGIADRSPLILPLTDIVEVILDPHRKLAEYYRFNNKWPRLRNNVIVQPFAALPDWTSYRVTVNPTIWSDWDGEKRFGLKLTSGFGVDLWPAYPSDFRHRISLEVNAHAPYDTALSWGGRLSYGHPLSLKNRFFTQLNMHVYDDWEGVSLGLVKYVGKQSYLIQGPQLTYQRLDFAAEYDNYADSTIWIKDQKINVIKAGYSGLSLTRLGDRLYVNMRAAYGEGPAGKFSLFKANSDLSGVFWGWLVGGLQIEGGFQSKETPEPYQFTHIYAWQDALSAIPIFRGLNKLTNETHNYMGMSISGGYWLSGTQLKVFSSSMIIDMDDVGWQAVKPRHAAGFGFEHNSFFTVGLYFPLWQSHPLEGEQPWAWRYQWRLTWNL